MRNVKICGLTRPEDARLAAELGATHVGVVLAPDSPRAVHPPLAREIFDAAGARVTPVLVLRGVELRGVAAVAEQVGADTVQLHGYSDADAGVLEATGLQVWRVHTLPTSARRVPRLTPPPSARRPAVLDVGAGGTGIPFRWELLGPTAPEGLFIAGGIRPDNVQRLMTHSPWGIDLSSGVEASPGIKHPDRMAALFQALELIS